MTKVFDFKEVSKHNTPSSCWVIIANNVYDVTSFLPSHPGGPKSILRLAGKDATADFDPIHPPGTLSQLPPTAHLGTIDPSTLPSPLQPALPSSNTNNPIPPPPTSLSQCLNLHDIETLATSKLPHKAWAYYFSAADDLLSKSLNRTVYSRILLRPRIFVDVTKCNTSTTFLSHPVALPFYVSPAAMARLAHPSGEAGIAAACAKYGVAQIISHNASTTPEAIVAAASPTQVFGWQLYVQTNRAASEAMLARIAALPSIKFIVLTLDAPVAGKREHDERTATALSADVVVGSGSGTGAEERAARAEGGVGKALFAGTAMDLTWSATLEWLGRHTNLPIVLKGVQTHEDAVLASRYPGVKGLVLSNHGGRAMDTAPPAVHTLMEIRRYAPGVFERCEVWVDGGVGRGTDVVKALCLGARGVGVGRGVLWGLGAGGVEGVERVFEILKGEVETCMRLLGVERVEELGMRHINARAVERDIYEEVLDLKARL
ncbi:hypothetical protein EJ06DRAFT_559301 [Trichodelitschia bisporula]|uniref:L-lactate dehydrogenase (cytochrome) n=1 Tax=Trichodelitschia bisporula TaxID=703511 RepID=A0A6G1HN51_9PEZI|nr:hypothetical protein EJ06DRAFT_559301 [Trichodelitschia bisporula]